MKPVRGFIFLSNIQRSLEENKEFKGLGKNKGRTSLLLGLKKNTTSRIIFSFLDN